MPRTTANRRLLLYCRPMHFSTAGICAEGWVPILWSLSAKVLDHSSDTKHDCGEQNRNDDRRPSGRVRGYEPRRDNEKSSREACHCYPLLGDSRKTLTSGFLRERSWLRPMTTSRARHAVGDLRENLEIAV